MYYICSGFFSFLFFCLFLALAFSKKAKKWIIKITPIKNPCPYSGAVAIAQPKTSFPTEHP
jgi:hypothetical protein